MARVSLEFTGLSEFKRDLDKSIDDLEKETKKAETKEARQKLDLKLGLVLLVKLVN